MQIISGLPSQAPHPTLPNVDPGDWVIDRGSSRNREGQVSHWVVGHNDETDVTYRVTVCDGVTTRKTWFPQ